MGLLFVYTWVGLSSFILFFILDIFGLLRVKRQEEEVTKPLETLNFFEVMLWTFSRVF